MHTDLDYVHIGMNVCSVHFVGHKNMVLEAHKHVLNIAYNNIITTPILPICKCSLIAFPSRIMRRCHLLFDSLTIDDNNHRFSMLLICVVYFRTFTFGTLRMTLKMVF